MDYDHIKTQVSTGSLFVLTRYNSSGHAGSKAPKDFRQICIDLGALPIDLPVLPEERFSWSNLRRLIVGIGILTLAAIRLRAKDCVIVQHPIVGRVENIAIAFALRKCWKVCIVHDLDYIRKPTLKHYDDIRMLLHFDVVIVHNEPMKKALETVLPKSRLVSMEVFDYTLKSIDVNYAKCDRASAIYIIGNLHPMKAAYLYCQRKGQFPIKIYGPNCDMAALPANSIWQGLLNMDDPKIGDVDGFGLVWDGPSVDSLKGEWGEYLKVNTPHKFSFYIALGLPVIVPREAAISEFVLRHGVGLTANSIEDACEIAENCSASLWHELLGNVSRLRAEITSGHYTRAALKSALCDMRA